LHTFFFGSRNGPKAPVASRVISARYMRGARAHLASSGPDRSRIQIAKMMFRMLVLLFAAVSAFEVPSVLSRRSFAQAVAAAPLAIAAAANADSNNGYMNAVGKSGLGAGSVDKYGVAPVGMTKGDSKMVDESGSASKGSNLTPAQAAAFANSNRAKTPAQEAALKRLLAK